MALSIGQVAERSGLGIETIRFYERKGLIDEPSRKQSGYRQYTAEVVDRLAFIQKAKSLGFSLAEINELLSLKISPDTSSREIKKIAQAKLVDIDEKIKMLQKMRRSLKKLVHLCPGQGPLNECPILNALD